MKLTLDEYYEKYSYKPLFGGEPIMDKEDFKKAMIEFAFPQVTLALESACEKVDLLVDGEKNLYNKYIVSEGNHYSETEISIDKESILLSYPLENIK